MALSALRAKPEPVRVSELSMRLCGLVMLLVACLLVLACASLPANTASGAPPPPPRPGSSITHTRMCSCTACAEAGCCQGSADERPSQSKSCGKDYDFSKQGCGMAIESCVSRCYERMWRVQLAQDCAEKRPEECCG